MSRAAAVPVPLELVDLLVDILQRLIRHAMRSVQVDMEVAKLFARRGDGIIDHKLIRKKFNWFDPALLLPSDE